MQFIRTAFWVILAVAIALFSKANWDAATPAMPGRVAIKLWGDLIFEARLPVLIISAFLLGLVPMWLFARATRWHMRRRIDSVERALASTVVPAPAVVPDPLSPDPAVEGTGKPQADE